MKKISIFLACIYIFCNLFSILASGFEPNPYDVYYFDEYTDFLKNTPLPNNFVYYDDIKQIGDFIQFEILRDEQSKEGIDFSKYIYGVKDSTGHTISIVIVPERSLSADTGNVEDLNLNDMRTNNSPDSLIYQVDGVMYRYKNYRLMDIYWCYNGVYYILNPFVVTYPEDSTTFVGRLLYDARNAQQTVDSLYASDIDESTPQTTEPAPMATNSDSRDVDAKENSGCGGFSVFAGFIALACAAGAWVLVKKK